MWWLTNKNCRAVDVVECGVVEWKGTGEESGLKVGVLKFGAVVGELSSCLQVG